MLQFDQSHAIGATIKVIGIGGAGCNAVNTMIADELEKIDFIVANTDLQALGNNRAPNKIQLGAQLTRGLGAGAHPEIGRDAALESMDRIKQVLEGTDMLFVAAGMGGGTGTGAAPVIAEIARSMGILTVGVVTKPFTFEGRKRGQVAREGLDSLRQHVDSLIVIPNEKLFSLAGKATSLLAGFKMADEVLLHAIKSIADLINVPGLINLDFADVKTIMSDMGMAFMGIGTHSGDNRAAEAARMALSNPLLDDISIKGAQGFLINIAGGSSLTFAELEAATSFIQTEAHQDANIIFGAAIDDRLGDSCRLTVIATGFGNPLSACESAAPAQAATRPANVVALPDLPDIQMEKTRHDVKVVKVGTIISEFTGDGSYDIPTFIRERTCM